MLIGESDTQNFEHSEGKPLPTSSDTMLDVMTSRELYAAFVRNLKQFGEKRGLDNPNAIARAANMSANTIRNWVRLAPEAWPELKLEQATSDANYPRLDALEKVAGALNVDVWKLFHVDPVKLQADLDALQRYRDAEKP